MACLSFDCKSTPDRTIYLVLLLQFPPFLAFFPLLENSNSKIAWELRAS